MVLCIHKRSDIDYNILAKNFELETFDNLFTYEFMDAIKFRRQELQIAEEIRQEEEAKARLKKIKEETLRCHKVSLRMCLQQFCLENEEQIKNDIQEYLDNEVIYFLNNSLGYSTEAKQG